MTSAEERVTPALAAVIPAWTGMDVTRLELVVAGPGVADGTMAAGELAGALSFLHALARAVSAEVDAGLELRVRGERRQSFTLPLQLERPGAPAEPLLFRDWRRSAAEVLGAAMRADARRDRHPELLRRAWVELEGVFRGARVQSLALRSGRRALAELRREEWMELAAADAPGPEVRRRALLQPVSLSFDARYQWRFREDEGPVFAARMDDRAFLARLQQGGVALCADLRLRVVLRERGAELARRVVAAVEEVLEAVLPPRQLELFAARRRDPFRQSFPRRWSSARATA